MKRPLRSEHGIRVKHRLHSRLINVLCKVFLTSSLFFVEPVSLKTRRARLATFPSACSKNASDADWITRVRLFVWLASHLSTHAFRYTMRSRHARLDNISRAMSFKNCWSDFRTDDDALECVGTMRSALFRVQLQGHRSRFEFPYLLGAA